MPTRELRASYVLDAAGVGRGVKAAERDFAGLESSAARTGSKLDKTTSGYGSGLGKAAKDVDHFDERTSKLGGHLENLGESLGNWGVPFSGSLTKIGKDLDKAKASGKGYGNVLADVGKVAAGGLAGGLAVAGVESVKAAMGFDELITRLQTGAGESASNLKAVSDGILGVARSTGESSTDLANAMFLVESANFHGAAGLKVLQAAAQGAVVGGTDVSTMADAVTSALNAYREPASKASAVTSQLVEAVASGKMRMGDFAQSLSAVLPVAAAAHVSLAQVGGAVATMTGQGMSAQQATQDLANTLRSLQAPNSVAVGEMQQLGINSNEVAKNLGRNGLTGTLSYLTQTILEHMGPSGEVLLNSFNRSKAAAGDLQIMLGAMPAGVRRLAEEFMHGSLTMAEFRKQVPTNDQGMISQFTSLYGTVHGFNQLLKSGQPDAQTYEAALGKMVGGSTGLNTTLLLTGSNLATFESNTRHVAAAAVTGGRNVQGFSVAQKDLAVQLRQIHQDLGTVEIAFGNALIPKLQAAIHVTSEIVGWFEKHKAAAEALAAVIGGTLAVVLGAFVINTGVKMVRSVTDAGKALGRLGESAVGMGRKLTGMATGDEQLDALRQELAETDKRLEALGETGPASMARLDEAVEAFNEQVLAAQRSVAQLDAALDSATFEAFQAQVDATEASLGGLDAAMAEVAGTAPEAFAAIDEGMATVGETAMEVGPEVDAGLGPIGLIIAGITIAATLLSGHWKQIWGDIKDVTGVVVGGIVDAFHWVTGALSDVAGFVEQWGPVVLAVFMPLVGIPLLIAQHWKGFTGFFETAFKDIGKAVTTGVDDVVGFFEKLPGRVLSALGDAGSWLVGVGRKMIDGLVVGARDYLQVLEVLYVQLPEKMLGWVADAGSWLVSTGGKIIRGLWAGVTGANTWLAGQIRQIPGWLWTALSDAGSWLVNTGEWVIQGLINGMASFATHAAQEAVNVGKSIIHGVASALGIGSPSKVMHAHGQWTVEGLANGILDAAPKAVAAARTVARSVAGVTVGAPAVAAGTIGGAASRTGGGAGNIYITVHVAGPVTDTAGFVRTIAPQLRTELLGLQLSGGRLVVP